MTTHTPDCEPLGTEVPVPADAAFEANDGLSCDNTANDCHLLIVEQNLLFEVYSGNAAGGQIDALCLAVWDIDQLYPPEGHGVGCLPPRLAFESAFRVPSR